MNRFQPLLSLLLLSVAAPALAEDKPTVPQRVDRLEKEMRAVQRKVFPGGTPAYFEAEIQPPAAAPAAAGSPAGQPLNELTARVGTLERELSRVTSQIEELGHRFDVLSQQAARDRSEFDARIKAIEPQLEAPPPAAGSAPGATRPPAATPPRGGRPAEPAPSTPSPAETAPPPATKPAPSADPGEDAYMAGYRLWADKKFAEAETTLADAVKRYPKHKRASYARNLLGRAQLDGGKPATAAQTFYSNYQADPRGDRAPDSLFYLGQALTQLKKPAEACRAYGELEDVYGATLAEGLKGRLPAARKAANCS